MPYIYNDEDNAPMIDDDLVAEYTVYPSRIEMKAYESGVADEKKETPADGCWNCMNFDYNKEACTVNWNNMDESYYNPNTDDRELTDYCDDHETDNDAVWEDFFGGNDND